MAASDISPQSGYIQHHLVHLNNTGAKQDVLADFSIINYDSVFWSLLTGFLTLFFLYRAARRATPGVPGRFQAAVEVLVEWVDDQAKQIVPSASTRRFCAPLALTVFLWVVAMNVLDLLPVDLMPWVFANTGLGAEHGDVLYFHRILPTADLNVAMGMSVGVLLLTLYYGVKVNNPLGFIKGLFTVPFTVSGQDVIVMAPFNLLLNLIEYAAKTVSLGIRLFDNMFIGVHVFMLIALLGCVCTGFSGASFGLGVGHVLAGAAWAIFHILIVLLQAFIFMMLTLVYIGQAHEQE